MNKIQPIILKILKAVLVIFISLLGLLVIFAAWYYSFFYLVDLLKIGILAYLLSGFIMLAVGFGYVLIGTYLIDKILSFESDNNIIIMNKIKDFTSFTDYMNTLSTSNLSLTEVLKRVGLALKEYKGLEYV